MKGASFVQAHTAVAGNGRLSCAESEAGRFPIELEQQCGSGRMYQQAAAQRVETAPTPARGQRSSRRSAPEARGEPGRGARPANCRPPRVGPPETLESRRGRGSVGSGAAAATGCLRFRTAASGGGRRQERAEDAEPGVAGSSGGIWEWGNLLGRGLLRATRGRRRGGEGNGDEEEEEASTNRGSARNRARRVAAGGPGKWRL